MHIWRDVLLLNTVLFKSRSRSVCSSASENIDFKLSLTFNLSIKSEDHMKAKREIEVGL